MVNLNQDLNFAFISWLQLILKKKEGNSENDCISTCELCNEMKDLKGIYVLVIMQENDSA